VLKHDVEPSFMDSSLEKASKQAFVHVFKLTCK